MSQTAPSPPYQYSPITEPGKIRLILLQPSTRFDDELRCSLITVTLEECEDDLAEHYIALSYVWGVANDTRTISIDGNPLTITASLESALRHIRHERKAFRVWADGTCINQNDVEDRNLQVQQMSSIYSSASRTVIFLGASSPDCDSLFSFIRSQRSRSELTGPDTSHTVEDFQLVLENHVFTRPWFKRVWILQELVLSPDPWIQCGNIRIRWDWFCDFVSEAAIDYSNSQIRKNLLNMDNIRSTSRGNRISSPNTAGKSLLNLIIARQGSGATDPRDMIYGHLGLVDPETRKSISVNYNQNVIQLYEGLAIRCLNWKIGFSYFRLVRNSNSDKRLKDLPSWVPDWTNLAVSGTVPKEFYRDATTPRIYSTIVPHLLTIVGNLYGNIIKIIPKTAWPALPESSTDYQNFEQGLTDWISVADIQMLDLLKSLFKINMQNPKDYNIGVRGTIRSSVFQLIQAELPTQTFDTKVIKAIDGTIKDLYGFSQASYRGNQIVVLGNGNLAEVPQSLKIGDVLFEQKIHTYQKRRPVLEPILCVRPQNGSLTIEENSLIIKDLIRQESDGLANSLNIVPIQHCSFLSMITWGDGVSRDFLKSGGFRKWQILVIH